MCLYTREERVVAEFLPLFRNAAVKVLGYEKANKELRHFIQRTFKEKTEIVKRVCNELSQKMQGASDIAANCALENLFLHLSKMDFVQKKQADFAKKIRDILVNADQNFRKRELNALLGQEEVQTIFSEAIFAEVLQTSAQKVDQQEDFIKGIEGNFNSLASLLKQSAIQLAYSPEGIAVSALVDLFLNLFDMNEIAQGRDPLFQKPEEASDSKAPFNYLPMPGR